MEPKPPAAQLGGKYTILYAVRTSESGEKAVSRSERIYVSYRPRGEAEAGLGLGSMLQGLQQSPGQTVQLTRKLEGGAPGF